MKIKEPLVSSKWLHAHLDDPDLVILDATQKNNISGLTTDLGALQIKGARKFDIKNTFSDKESKYPNTLPSPEAFEKECRKLGINNSSKIIVYDQLGIYTSPRVWWMFRVMGHEAVAVLDGGLPDWVSEEYDTEPFRYAEVKAGDFKAAFNPALVKDLAIIKNNLKTKAAIILDARSKGRFDGTAPEPREGLRSGHIPNSKNLPYTEVLEGGKYKSKSELKNIFDQLDIDDRPIIFSCGSGITACVIMLAGALVMDKNAAVYDGSWTEWASENNL